MEIKIIRRKEKDGVKISGGRKKMEIKIISKKEKDVDQDYEGKRSRLRKTKKNLKR